MTDVITKASLRTDPLMPHLLDILSQPASEGLILAGGFGMRIKQAHLEGQIRNGNTLIPSLPSARATQDLDLFPSVPPARATQDLDLFLNMETWTQQEKGKAVRAMLDGLDYEVLKGYENLQFGKLRNPVTDKFEVKIDLHARTPNASENVKFDERRVGRGVGLHGRITDEAFAIDDSPTLIQVSGSRTDGSERQAAVLVPHAYASLNMKIKAAHDWLQGVLGKAELKENSEKHVFDVYLLVAMMLPREFEECRALAARYADHPMAEENRRNAFDLFASPDGRGFTEVLRQMDDLPADYDTFWEGLQGALAVSA